jgi:hypothetical protein
MTNAPAPYTKWNNTYGWTTRFTLTVHRSSCTAKATVKIKINGTVTAAQQTAMKSAIEAKWNGKAKLVCPDPNCPGACPNGYPISVEALFVTSGEHYTITAVPTTLDMTHWSVSDTVDITHEFGHMLGAPDEYFTVNGVDYSGGGAITPFRQPTAPIMNNPPNDPALRNYDVIRSQAATLMGTSCTTQAP